MKKIISLLVVLAMLMAMAPVVLADSIPSGSALALGDNNVELTYAMMPAMAPYWTYTATEGGYLTVTVSSINGNTFLDRPFGMGNYTLLVGDATGEYTNTATVYLNANDTVNIAVLDTMDMEEVPAVINVAFVAGEPVVERNPADYFTQDSGGNYIIPSLAEDVEIFVGNDDINYIYTAESAGTVTVTPSVEGYTATNCWITTNGVLDSTAAPVTVAAGDTVIINIWGGYEGTVSLTAGGNEGGGNQDGGSTVPSGSALALGDNNVELTYAMMPAMAPYWTYTATEGGYLTVTVSSINGNSGLGMAFGTGMYTLLVGESTGEYTNTATVYMNANDTVNIAVLDTMDMEEVPAVINVAFVAGEPVVERNPADYFTQDSDGNYIIPSLAEDVEIFVGNDDINYIYTAESAGTVTVTPSVEGYTATNCWITTNGVLDSTAAPVTVAAGDTVIINIWGGYEGTVSLTAGGNEGGGNEGDGNEGGGNEGGNNDAISGTATAVEDSKHVVPFSADQNGTLTITVGNGSAWASDVWSMSGTSPVQTGTAEATYTVDIVANTTYIVRIYGQGDPCAAISNIPYTITFTPSGTPVGPQLEEYVVGENKITEVGVYDLAVKNTEADTTLYKFEPTATGVYKVELTSGNVAMSQWSTSMYSENEGTVVDGVMTVTVTSVGQSVFIGLSGEDAAAQVTITKTGEASDEPAYQTIVYKNKVQPSKFDSSAYTVSGSVNIKDTTVDKAVLGTDGYYHLNSADGEILYVDFNSSVMSLTAAWGYGSTSYAVYDPDGKPISVTSYHDALGEYLQAEVKDGNYTYGNTYYPLTADLIEMLKNIGAHNDWYGENGLVGSTEDAWMFACVTMTGGTAGAGTGTGSVAGTGDNSKTGDALALVIAAFAVSGTGLTAAVASKKRKF